MPTNYVQISSGLGSAAPTNIFVVPVLFEGQVKAVIELASFYRFNETHLNFLGQLTESIGIVLNTITATMRTEELLKQSQSLATELQKTNEELEEKAELLAKQNAEVEQKNREIDQARLSLEDKAAQLALTSRYKSEFLANMSHELRTPLNSLLILSRLLAQNSEGTLTEKQVEFAKTIHASGSDLLELINEILDLSKIESGMMDVDAVPVSLADVQSYVDRTFREVAGSKGLTFRVNLDPQTIGSIITDQKRVQQVLKNLISNAIKFTEQGSVTLTHRAGHAAAGHRATPRSTAPTNVVAFRVEDTGIGIAPDKHQVIFEAFQQADGTTSRKYGGTGLGLSISREIAKLLGGEIRLTSAVGQGSTFTLFLPSVYVSTLTAGRARRRRAGRDAHRRRSRAGRGRRPGRRQPAQRRSPAHPARRSRAADHRERSRLRAHPDGSRAASTTSACSPRCAATSACRWRGSIGPTRSRSTSTCPASTAGTCSIG